MTDQAQNAPQPQPEESYYWRDDMHKSWLFALEAIRARVAAGGRGWGGYPLWGKVASLDEV